MDHDFIRDLTTQSTEADLLELSTYLDGSLDDEDQDLVRQRLECDDDYAALLQVLITTKNAIKQGVLQAAQADTTIPDTFPSFWARPAGMAAQSTEAVTFPDRREIQLFASPQHSGKVRSAQLDLCIRPGAESGCHLSIAVLIEWVGDVPARLPQLRICGILNDDISVFCQYEHGELFANYVHPRTISNAERDRLLSSALDLRGIEVHPC